MGQREIEETVQRGEIECLTHVIIVVVDVFIVCNICIQLRKG
jgi:hypothetical protein